jgi:hypothetical protein
VPHWKVDIQSLYLAVETVQRYRRMSARDAAQEMGVPASTLTRLKDGNGLGLDAFASIVSWLKADPVRFIVRTDGAGVPVDKKILVCQRDVVIAWSWAREALSGLPEHLQPPNELRETISQALQRLGEEIGNAPEPLEAAMESRAG